MSMHEVREDHGEFRIQIENEQALIAQAVQVASTNLERPGCYWTRIQATVNNPDGSQQIGQRIYGIDLFEKTVQISEEWDGIETARRKFPLEIQDPNEGHE